MPDNDNSLGDEKTLLGANAPQQNPQSLGDRPTLGGGDGSSTSDFGSIGDLPDHDMEIVDLSKRYRIEKSIGRGGMGEVFLATDDRLNRQVAIKRIRTDARVTTKAISRFLAEAKAVASLSHQNIVQIYDYGRDNDGPFLIMEYASGGTIYERFESDKIPLEQAVSLISQLCDGLAHAHHAGIIHRDIKPANILLSSSGIPKLSDFGLAKATAQDQSMTQSGVILGTIDFMSPEQRMDSSQADARSDLWSLAATFYQMVTGTSPRIINLTLTPRRVQSILEKSFQEDPRLRYQTPEELKTDLSLLTGAKYNLPIGEKPLQIGECMICGTDNQIDRKHCRECGEVLKTPCLSCGKVMDIWDKACGFCGSKQQQIADGLRAEYQQAMQDASERRETHHYDEALAVIRSLCALDNPRFADIKRVSLQFVEDLTREKQHVENDVKEWVKDAMRCHSKCKDREALALLEKIPESLRTDSIERFKNTIVRDKSELANLQQKLEQAEDEYVLVSLLPEVERLIELRGGPAELLDKRKSIVSFAERHDAVYEETIAKALKEFQAGNYYQSIEILNNAPSQILGRSRTAETIRVRAQEKLSLSDQLVSKIQEIAAVNSDDFQQLVPLLRQYRDMHPNDQEIQKQLERLLKIENDRYCADREMMEQASRYRKLEQYDKAVEYYAKISTDIYLQRSENLRRSTEETISKLTHYEKSIESCLSGDDLETARTFLQQYLELKSDNDSFRQLLVELTALLQAKLFFEQKEVSKSLEMLSQVKLPVLSAHRSGLGNLIAMSKRRRETLRQKITESITPLGDVERLGLIEEYLELDPNDKEICKIADSLLDEARQREIYKRQRDLEQQTNLYVVLYVAILLVAVYLLAKSGFIQTF